MIRPITFLASVLVLCLLIVPAVIVQFMPKGAGQVQEQQHVPLAIAKQGNAPVIMVSVYRTETGDIEKVPLEAYIRGVVASEMPTDFELEALKAQALAARTYIIRRLVEKDFSDVPEGSVVTDTIKHQVFQNEEELRARWGIEYERKISRINEAVNATMGLVLTFQGHPINATFFSTSNGYTENSEDYWGAEIPYLRSVESPWDTESPHYKNETTMSIEALQDKLNTTISVPASSDQPVMEVVSRTAGNRVSEVAIGDQTFTGKEIRELLELDSSHFDISIVNQSAVIQTTGYGHGVGMSQWGANGMAAEGHTAEEIVQYYYENIAIEDYRQWIASNQNTENE
ncbi:stage II sporulation protein D [Caldalkalibacillus salinus]|uniref:stage II sporulation protein D n=1 Tax=Caldalkalibacillus salinus TaxID=2803787 RepID=UPI0019242343|nr:stage II sporulation protein D [Caldalkalibacillus salinus]